MKPAGAKADEILDAAEGFARTRGYNGFSFRDVAAEVGIKSASVHYHYPTKADLGAAVAARYTNRFIEKLGDPADPAQSPEALLARHAAAFRHSLADDNQMCLCGMLGAEIASLPTAVAVEAKAFFERNIDWLQAVLGRTTSEEYRDDAATKRRALTILAALEGAILLARTLGRIEVFDQVAEEILRLGAPTR